MDWLKLESLPPMARVRRVLGESARVDATSTFEAELKRTGLLTRISRGARVAVAVGSRGIHQHANLVSALLRCLQQAGLQPFIVPAMGSHGGATPEGQLRLLADAGMTPETLDVPFEADMAVDLGGRTADGVEVFTARTALQAEAILLINRVKPHTDFGGAIGSGLLKMLVVGLGKHAGALAFHRAAHRLGYERALRSMAAVALRALPILGGAAILEDARHRTHRLEVVSGHDLEEAEPRLAAEAATMMPLLPLEEIDLLIVDRIGKEISGTGMDPNVIGRMIHGYSLIETELPLHPRIRRIFVRDLSPASHGNATGIGMADFTTTRLVEAMDREATYTNALTALSLQGSKIPIHFPTDREAVAAAVATLGLPDPRTARVVRIRDTLSIEEVEISESGLGALSGDAGWRVSVAPGPMRFDDRGDLVSW